MWWLALVGCGTEGAGTATTPPAQPDPCAGVTELLPLGRARGSVFGGDACDVQVESCVDEACAARELRRVPLDGSPPTVLAGDVAEVVEVGEELVIRHGDGRLTTLDGGLLLEGVDHLWVTDPHLIARTGTDLWWVPPDGAPEHLDADDVELVTDAGAALSRTGETVGSGCAATSRGALTWFDPARGTVEELDPHAGAVLGAHPETATVVYERVLDDGAREVVVGGWEGDEAVFRVLPGADPLPVGGCGSTSVDVALSPDGAHLAFRQIRFELEDSGHAALYPTLELEVVARDAVSSAPLLVPCSDLDQPQVVDDGVLCFGEAVTHTGWSGAVTTVLDEEVSRLEPLADGSWLVQTYDDDAPLLEGAFRVAHVERLSPGSEEVRSHVVEGFLVDLHLGRYVVVSELPESWLWSRPEDIGWSVLDLDTGATTVLSEPLRPEGVLDEHTLLYGVWGVSEHDDDVLFLGPVGP